MKPLPALPYDSIPEDDLVKVQSLVLREDKDILLTVIPDRGLFSLLIQNAFKRTANHIRENGLEYSNAGRDSLIEYITGTIRDDAAAHAVGTTLPRNDGRQKAGTSIPPKSVQDVKPNVRQGAAAGRQGNKSK